MSAPMTVEILTEATEQFYSALADVLGGDADAMLELLSQSEDSSYLGPMGGYVIGAADIRDAWVKQAEVKLGGTVTPSALHYVVGGDLGVVTGWEKGALHRGLPGEVNIRATSTYRIEDGRPRMIGHHTDLISD